MPAAPIRNIAACPPRPSKPLSRRLRWASSFGSASRLRNSAATARAQTKKAARNAAFDRSQIRDFSLPGAGAEIAVTGDAQRLAASSRNLALLRRGGLGLLRLDRSELGKGLAHAGL